MTAPERPTLKIKDQFKPDDTRPIDLKVGNDLDHKYRKDEYGYGFIAEVANAVT